MRTREKRDGGGGGCEGGDGRGGGGSAREKESRALTSQEQVSGKAARAPDDELIRGPIRRLHGPLLPATAPISDGRHEGRCTINLGFARS